MINTYQIYLISDSTGETLDRIFLALKAQFLNTKYKVKSYKDMDKLMDNKKIDYSIEFIENT